MDVSLATFAALFVLVAAAGGTPIPLQDACVDVRSSSLELNRLIKTVSIKARNGSNDMADFSTSIAWMEATDMCDPVSLKEKSMTCTGKMLSVIRSYHSTLERISGFQSCSVFVRNLMPSVEKLEKDMSKCVKSIGGEHHEKESHISKEKGPEIENWKEPFLCFYTLDRLFSFSILSARVFAVGDPAHHTDGSGQKCM